MSETETYDDQEYYDSRARRHERRHYAKLRTLAHEAMSVGWHNAGYLRAFIDGDDGQVFSDADARFIEAVTPQVVLGLIEEIEELRGVGEPAPDTEVRLT